MQPTVLIVDDSATIRALIRVHLVGLGVDFLEASDGEEGLKMACSTKPTAIVVDLKMPKMDGLAFCRAVRAEASLKDTPIILLTSATGAVIYAEARDAGSTCFLNKPINTDLLKERMTHCLRKAGVRP